MCDSCKVDALWSISHCVGKYADTVCLLRLQSTNDVDLSGIVGDVEDHILTTSRQNKELVTTDDSIAHVQTGQVPLCFDCGFIDSLNVKL